MSQYRYILANCRIPGQKVDSFINVSATDPDPSRHITVVHNNHVGKSLGVKLCQRYLKKKPKSTNVFASLLVKAVYDGMRLAKR